ncbi:phospholipase A [Thorsellia kenyensis]|uniref:Phospholipase A1 n=1 Tax=Thorsellia kenyensis TaxID=1549888 RepID=A0ABV6C8K8_9GAMM
MLTYPLTTKKNISRKLFFPLFTVSLSFVSYHALAGNTSEPTPGSVISEMMRDHERPFLLFPYDTNYLLFTHTSNLNKKSIAEYEWAENADKQEAKFQISLGFPIYRGIAGNNSLLGFSYTQQSWWQSFNTSESAPFRETNYEPQLFLGWETDYRFGDWVVRELEMGFNHQSNGKADPTSRSWNRLYGRAMAQNGNLQVDLKPFWRIPENKKNDDNPNITDYTGHYRLKLAYKAGESTLSAEGGYNWNTGYGGAELGWSYPITNHVRFYTQLYSGYSESLIDYDHKQTRIGLGFMLNDIF